MDRAISNIDVVKLTEVAMLITSLKLDVNRQLDRELFQHIAYVTNRILMIAKKKGINVNSLEEMGEYIWRLIRVVQAYNSKKRDVTIEEIMSIFEEFKSVFGG